MKLTRRLAALLLVFAFAMSLPTPALAAETPATTNNADAHEYVWGRWATPSESGLSYDAATGGYTRVEYTGEAVVVETYDSGFVFTGSQTVTMELPIYGGFHAGEDYNFLIFGQTNTDEIDSTEVIRVVKYDKNWNRLGQASLLGANTTIPFDAGSVSTAEYNGYLYIRTSHEMYTSDDGKNHQANLTMNVRISDMVITDSFYDVMNSSYGYVSHSFCQFIAIDEAEKKIVAVDHGDAYPRAVTLTKYCAPAGQDSFMEQVRVDLGDGWYSWKYVDTADVLPIVGQNGANDTGVSLGGFGVSDDAYLTVGNTVPQTEADFDLYAQRNIFVTVTDKDLSNTEQIMLTNYTDADDVEISNPYLVRIDGGRLLVLWMEDTTLCYTFLDSTGTAGDTYRFEIKGSFPSCLSDCQPIVAGDKVVWYVTANCEPVFFSIDLTNPAALTETHNYVGGVCNVCGASDDGSGSNPDTGSGSNPDTGSDDNQGNVNTEPATVVRLAGAHRWTTSLMVADAMKANLGVEKFNAIIIASGNDFADALAGSYLSTVKDAPILLSWGKGGSYAYLDENNITYIKANLAEGGTVYILGGTSAVPEAYETSLSGCNVKRLGGANRFETNLLILEEAGVSAGEEVLVCTSTNFADSLSASATGEPILLVFNESGSLYGRQPEYLASLSGCTFTVIGGENAVCPALEEAIGAYGITTRLAGSDRFETSVLVAETYFDAPEAAVLAYAWNYPDGLCGGALAYSMDCPLILTMTKYESQAAGYVQGNGIRNGVVLGGTGLISDESVRIIFGMGSDEQITVIDEFTLPEVEDDTTEETTSGSFTFYNYETGEFLESDVSAYHEVTGVACNFSSGDWGFTGADYTDDVDGYDPSYGIYVYDYDTASMNAYISYLESVGFTLYGTEQFVEGISYYYYNSESGFYMDLFVDNAQTYVAIEPFCGVTLE